MDKIELPDGSQMLPSVHGAGFTIRRLGEPEECAPPFADCNAPAAYSIEVSDSQQHPTYLVSRCKEHLLYELRRTKPQGIDAARQMEKVIDDIELGRF